MNKLRKIGLARVLSKLGYCSRSQAAILISGGRVALNGQITRDPESPVRVPRDHVSVDGSRLVKAPTIYLVMNKPRGIVTTASDEKGRATVYDLLEPGFPWVGPVGRLDKASEGLLLLTNDSEWAARIADPEGLLDKTYHVQVDRAVDADLLAKIAREPGEEAESAGDSLRAKEARRIRHGVKNTWLEITLDEGKNRQIRRLLEGHGVGVVRLVRVSIGPLELGDLKKGSVRPLTPEEKNKIDIELK